MLAFLKNTLAQINTQTRQGAAPVVRVHPQAAAGCTQCPQQPPCPAGVDAVTSGTQPIARYFAAQAAPRPADSDEE